MWSMWPRLVMPCKVYWIQINTEPYRQAKCKPIRKCNSHWIKLTCRMEEEELGGVSANSGGAGAGPDSSLNQRKKFRAQFLGKSRNTRAENWNKRCSQLVLSVISKLDYLKSVWKNNQLMLVLVFNTSFFLLKSFLQRIFQIFGQCKGCKLLK